MIGRLLEDGVWLAQFAWHYHKASERAHGVGFYSDDFPMMRRDKLKYAWRASHGLGKKMQ